MTDRTPKPCACTLTEAPQHIRGSFDRIEWALEHLAKAGEDCLRRSHLNAALDNKEGWTGLDAVHNMCIRICTRNTIRASVAVHRDLFSTILGEVDSESEIAQMIRELGVE